MAFKHRHLLSIADLSRRDIDMILTARSLKDVSHRAIKKVPALRGKAVFNCFFESSTRTRTSFELAAKRLSADTTNFSPSGSAMSKGESIFDTIDNLEAMQPDLLVIRHGSGGMTWRIANRLKTCYSVINAGDGMHEHPTQALLDAMTILESKGKIRGLTVAILGDVLHSRVARSNILLLNKMGARVIVAGPSTLMPFGIESMGVERRTVDQAVAEADVLMSLRIQRERLGQFAFPSLREYARHFGLNAERMKRAKEDVLIMHPGPVNRGVELSPDVADGPHSVILDQVENGIAVRMACLYLLAGGKRDEA